MTWNDVIQREQSRLEAADWARECKRREREIVRREAARKFRKAAVKHSAELVLADMSEAAVMAAAPREAKAARAMVQAAADMGMPVAELAEALDMERRLVAAELALAARAVRTELRERRTDKEREAADKARAERAAKVRPTFADMAASEAAEAARQTLRAIGRTAAAVVVTAADSKTVTVAEVHKVPDVAAAEARAEAARNAYAKAADKLAEAETKVKAAEAMKAVRPIREANKEADRIAAGVRKIAFRVERAEAALEAAKEAANVAEAAGLITVPVGTFKAATAALEAAELELPERADMMPVGYIESGPTATHTVRPVSDPVGLEAAKRADGWLDELETAMQNEAAREAKMLAEAERLAASQAAAATAADSKGFGGRRKSTEAERAEAKARKNSLQNQRRREAKIRNR